MKKQPYLWLLLFAILALLSNGRLSWLAASWIAPIFGLRFLATVDAPGRKRAWHLYLAFWLALSIAWYGATPIWGVAHFIFMGVNAFFGLIPFLVHDWIGRQLRPTFITTLAFPLAAVSVEFLTINGSPFGNFGAEGYTQYNFNLFVQIVSVTGMLGITFMTTWFAATVNWVWAQIENGRAWQIGLVIYGTALLVVLTFGGVRLANASPIDEGVSVTGLSLHEVEMSELGPLLANDLPAFRAQTQAIHADYLAETAVAIADGATIILWPELAGIGVPEDVDALLSAGRDLAQTHDIYLAIPTITLYPDGAETAINQLHLLDPNGDEALTHVKYGGNFIEGTVAGDGILQIAETPYGKIAAAICWDADFPNVIAQAGEQGVDILLTPSKDWAGINPLHGRMSAFRAIENGMTVVRQADAGWSVITDPYGRTLSSGSGVQHQQSAIVPTAGVTTLYPRLGDALGWLSLVGLLALVGSVWVRGRKK